MKALQNLRGFANLFRNPSTQILNLANSKSHLNFYLKASLPCFHFAYPSMPCENFPTTLRSLSVPWPPFEGTTYTSLSISAMACMRGGYTDPSVSCEQRPRASPSQDSSQALEAQTASSSKGGVPFSPPQLRYATRRPPTSLPLEPSVCRIPSKRARTSDLGESFSMHSLIFRPLLIFSVFLALPWMPSSRGLW